MLHEGMTAEIIDSIHSCLCCILGRWIYDVIRPAKLRPCRRMGTVNHCWQPATHSTEWQSLTQRIPAGQCVTRIG